MKTLHIVCCYLLLLAACGKYKTDVVTTAPIDIGGIPDSYAELEENTILNIPVKFYSEAGLDSAAYKIANNRASQATVNFSPIIKLPVKSNSIDTILPVPIRKGTMAIVIMVYDKSGKLSTRSIDISSIKQSEASLKTFTDLTMSTDPADNINFLSLYETSPVYGAAVAKTKQHQVDFMLVNLSGAKFLSAHAYGAGAEYYTATKNIMAGFTTLTYGFLTSSRTYVNRTNFNAITTNAQLNKFIDDSVINPKAGNYNVMAADRRVSDGFTVTGEKGFIAGWGYHTAPTATPTVVLNESFALFIVKTVTKKSNGHYVITFDVKAPDIDNRLAFPEASIIPYSPYPL